MTSKPKIKANFRLALQLDFDQPEQVLKYLADLHRQLSNPSTFAEYVHEDGWPHSSTLYRPDIDGEPGDEVGKLYVGPQDRVRSITATSN